MEETAAELPFNGGLICIECQEFVYMLCTSCGTYTENDDYFVNGCCVCGGD